MIRCQARMVWILYAGIILLLPAAASHAQTSQATLQGQVTNQASGQPVPKALVIERNLQTNSQSYHYSNEPGFYYFSALLPGAYSVRVDALGFQPEERSPVELQVASRIELNFALKASAAGPAPAGPVTPKAGASAANILSVMYGSDAAVPQAVMVTLPVQATETLVGSISSLISEREILELPLLGRDVYTLLVLQPGVSSDNATGRGLGFSVNGERVGSSNFLLDGVDNNDLIVTGRATAVSADAVQEYRMTTSNYSAEYGRASGFIANAITRTGTNALHGTLFEFFNHDRLNANSFANNWQDIARAPYRQNQYGASLGGPLRRDRLFFFGNLERFRSSSQSQPLSVFVPGPQLLALLPQGSPAQQLLTEFPPPAGTPIPGSESLDCRTNGNACFVEKSFFIPAIQENSLALGRADYNSADGRQHLSGRYAFSQETTQDAIFSVYSGLNAPLVIRGQNLGANYTRDWFGGANEVKFGYSRSSTRLLRPRPELPTITSFDGVLSPRVVLLPGMESNSDYAARNSVFHVIENYSRPAGSHALGFGLEWRLGFTDSLSSQFSSGEYGYPTWADFFVGNTPVLLILPVNRFTGSAPSANAFRSYYSQAEWAGFFQDNYKVTRRLTLNLGLRYEYFGVPAPRNGTLNSNFIFGPGQNVEQRIASGGLKNEALYSKDFNNFAPRFGFALDLEGNGKSVLRGGFGIFYDRIFDNIWLNVRNNNLPLQCLVQPPFGGTCNFPSIQSPFTFAMPAGQGINPLNPASVPNTSTVSLDSNPRTPYSENWFLGFQRELTPNLVLEVNQVGSLGRKLITADGINRAHSLPPTTANPLGRFNPSFGDILYYATQGHSNHVAIEAALKRRWSHGVQFQISYTYARTKDVQSDPLIVAGNTGATSAQLAASNLGSAPVFMRQFDPSADYGNSDFDQRHNLVMNFVAQTPRFQGWRKLLSGWQASGLAGIRSGFPFSIFVKPVFSAGERATPNRADFIGSNPSQAFLASPTQVPGGIQMLDPSLFQIPPGNQLGNLARNTLFGPGFWNADIAFSRSFALRRLGEQRRLQFRAEFFNIFNHANLNNPNTFLGNIGTDGKLISNPAFGQATFGRQGFGSALPGVAPLNERPRLIQFGLKFYF